MTVVNLPTLKIHQLSQEQFNKAKNEGTLDNNAIYLTPDEQVQSDWNQNDDTAPDYIKNRTHYETEELGIGISEIFDTFGEDAGSGLGMEYKAIYSGHLGFDEQFYPIMQKFENKSNLYLSIGNTYNCKVSYIINDNTSDWLVYLEDGNIIALQPLYGGFPNSSARLSDELKELFINYEPLILYSLEEKKVLHPLDEKYIPDTIARKNFVEEEVNSLIDTAPEALNTLNKLSMALDNDPNFSTTVLTKLGKKVEKINGKGLSTNDYTTIEKNKLSGIEDGAEKNIQSNWNQNDETASDYIKNRTHYETEKIERETITIKTSGYDPGSGGGMEYKAVITTDIDIVNNFLTKQNLKMSIGEYEFKIKTITKLEVDNGERWLLELENGYNCALLSDLLCYPFYGQQLPPEIMPLFEAEEPLYLFAENKVKIIHQLDEKFIPNTYATIELLNILNINDFTTVNLTEDTFDHGLYNHLRKKTFAESSIKELYIKLYNHYKTNLIPNLDISPNKDYYYFKKLCSFERADLIFKDTSLSGSMFGLDPWTLKYYFNLSNSNSLVIIFNINKDTEGPNLDSLDTLLQGEISLAFELCPKGTNITNEQLKQLAQEQIITPALTEEVY